MKNPRMPFEEQSVNCNIDLTTEPALRYSEKESVLINIETDSDFLKDIWQIADKKRAYSSSIFEAKEEVTDSQCEKIHEKAMMHRYANIFNTTTVLDHRKIEDSIACNCGCNKGAGQQFPICMNEQNLTFLGPGVLLFFFSLRQLRLTMAMAFLIYGSFSLIANIAAYSSNPKETCPTTTDSFSYVYCQYNVMSSSDNKFQYTLLYTTQLWLGLVFCVIWVFSVKAIKYFGQLKDQHIDQLLDSASDYTVRLENLPFGEYAESQLYQFLNQLWKTREDDQVTDSPGPIVNKKPIPLRLRSIQIVYNMQECRDLINLIQTKCYNLTKLFEEIEENKINNVIQPNKVELYKLEKLSLIDKYEQLENLRRKFLSSKQFRRTISTTCALIQFHSDSQQKQFVSAFGSKMANVLVSMCMPAREFSFRKARVAISRAPQPSDLNWLNCEKQFSYFRYGMVWLATFIMLAISFSVVSFLQTTDLIKSGNNILIAVVLQLFNRAIWITLSYMVVYQYNNSKTDSIMSLMKKAVLAQAINIIVGPTIAKFINNKGIYGKDGLTSIALFYQFVMFGLMLFYYVFNPINLTKSLIINVRCFRNRMINYLSQVVGEIDTIEEIRPVLEYYEGPEFPVAGMYVYITTAIFHTMFFCHLQPTIMLILVVNITGFYYVAKYMLFRTSKIPQLTELQVFQFAMFCASCGAAFYCAGSIFFQILYWFEQPQISVNLLQLLPAVLGLIFWLVGALNPFGVFDKFSEWLIDFLDFRDRLFVNNNRKKENIEISGLINQILMHSDFFENKLTTRKQSYYKYSHVNKLLQIQDQLKEMQNKDGYVKRNRAMEFCEGFFKRQHNSTKKQYTIQKPESSNKENSHYSSSLSNIDLDDKKSDDYVLVPVTRLFGGAFQRKDQNVNGKDILL